MGNIFSAAFTVLIWLGTPGALDLDVQGFHDLLPVLDALEPLPELLCDTPSASSEDLHAALGDELAVYVLQTFDKLTQAPWFSRVWVLQEYVLSTRPACVLVGDVLFSIKPLHKALQPLTDLVERLSGPLASAAPPKSSLWMAHEPAFGHTYIPERLHMQDFASQSVAAQLLWILSSRGYRRSTVPHDQVYGLLRMTDTRQLPGALTPEYRLPYCEVYKAYVRYIIAETGDLRLLECRRGGFVDGQPSWVPDI